MKIELYLIRHGKTRSNEEKRYVGRATDIGLNESGKAEIREKAAAGCYPKEPRFVFSSPMKRALETAQIIYPEKEKIIIDDLAEIEFGIFEGKNYTELNGTPEFQSWIDSGGKMQIPGGESLEDFCLRVKRGLEKLKSIVLEKMDGAGRDTTETGKTDAVGGTVVAGGAVVAGGTVAAGGADAGEAVVEEEETGENCVQVALICHGGTIMAARRVLEGKEYFDSIPDNGESCLVEL